MCSISTTKTLLMTWKYPPVSQEEQLALKDGDI
jgi:hypothetical protein